jgi:DNA-binding SARP family transcriptional activator
VAEAVEPAAPLSSTTLAELYFGQGLVDRAIEVYGRLLQEEPGNEKARVRLAELQGLAGGTGGVAARAARQRALERTIADLEKLLSAVRRRR